MEETTKPKGNVRRLKSLKRKTLVKQTALEEIKLENVLGVTLSKNTGISSSSSGIVAYPAGCVIVLLDPSLGQRHIINTEKKAVTCLSWAPDGDQQLVSGESGHKPAVKVWDVGSLSCLVSLTGHKFGVRSVSFSPDNKFVISVGTEHDMVVNVWDWRNSCKVATNKMSFNVSAISFAKDGSYFVAAGNRHLKFWYLESSKQSSSGTVPLAGRSAILAEQRNNNFLDVVCGKGVMENFVYAITKSGLLCLVNSQRLLEKWVELKVARASALCVGEDHVMVGCSKGLVRCFSSRTLHYLSSLPAPESALQPSDVSAMSYHEATAQLTVIYTDHSLALWSLSDLHHSRLVSFQSLHSSCIWSLESYRSSCSSGSSLVTCGDDDTIRVWSLDQGPLLRSRVECLPQNTLHLHTAESERPGVRCVRVSPDGRHLVSGDRSGNIRVHNTNNLNTVCTIEAHDSEVMCLDFGGNYLASGSRDRLIHLFDVKNKFEFLTTLEDHSSCVTAVRFLSPAASEWKLVSCGADKSIITRSVQEEEGGVRVTRVRHSVCATVPYDLAVEKTGQVSVACQDRNVRVYSNLTTANKPRTVKGSASEDGHLFKIVFDRSETYFATSCTDKSIAVFDCQTGELLTTLVGHSEIVTGLAFSHDCKYLISVSGDSCIFVWKLTRKMTALMMSRLGEVSEEEKCRDLPLKDEDVGEMFGSPPKDFLIPDQEPANAVQIPDFRFSVGKLPVWARTSKQVTKEDSMSLTPRGKWGSKGQLDDPLKFLEDQEEQEGLEEVSEIGAKKTLMFLPSSLQEECDYPGLAEEFQVNATDLDTLRKSQSKLVLPHPGEGGEEDGVEDISLDLLNEDTMESSCCVPDIPEEEESFTQVKTLGIFTSEEEDLLQKPLSISKAWREGTTPVQKKQQQMVSIERLLATNQLNSVLRGITPVKSPCLNLAKHKLSELNSLELEGGSGTPERKTLKEPGQLSKELISETIGEARRATEELLLLFKRVSLDEDLEDSLRGEMMTTITEGTSDMMDILRLIQVQDKRSQSEIAAAAMESIRNFQKSLSEKHQDDIQIK